MPEMIAIFVWFAVAAYAAIGGCVMLCAVAFGMARFDANAARAPLRVKMLLAPGMIALWPIMLARMFGRRPVEDSQ